MSTRRVDRWMLRVELAADGNGNGGGGEACRGERWPGLKLTGRRSLGVAMRQYSSWTKTSSVRMSCRFKVYGQSVRVSHTPSCWLASSGCVEASRSVSEGARGQQVAQLCIYQSRLVKKPESHIKQDSRTHFT